MQVVEIVPTVEGWRTVARRLLRHDVRPGDVVWQAHNARQTDLLGAVAVSSATAGADDVTSELRQVPRAFLELAESVACHSDAGRWDALYRVLYRLANGEPSLLEVATDADIYRLRMMDRAIRREVHKMHAFVRFRVVNDGTTSKSYVAWFEPAHDVVERAVPLFTRRFASMRWSVLTPGCCAHWDGSTVHFTPGVPRSMAPDEDVLEELWRTYYAHIFNPARLSTDTMRAEMPVRYWRNLPEARLIPELTRDAAPRVLRMLQQLDKPAQPLPEHLEGLPDRLVIPNAAASPNANGVSAAGVARPEAQETSWDPTHDPGVSAARSRSSATRRNDDARVVVGVNGTPVRIGTASWTDPTILERGVFYPDTVNTPEERLRYYASRYSLVEVDATYYVLPTRAMAAAWAARTPDDFVFDVKAFALMTGHPAEIKRLPDWLRRKLPSSLTSSTHVRPRDLSASLQDEVWERFLSSLGPLRDAGKLGPVLLQYPRWFVPSRESADELRVARERLGHACAAVEFRNPGWVTGRIASRTMRLLEELQLTYVMVDAPPGTSSSMPPVAEVTTPGLAVVRLHGRRTSTWESRNPVVSERYRYLYDRSELSAWVQRVNDVTTRLRDVASFPDMAKAKQGVHVVFNNCHANYGTTNADEITALLIEFDNERRL